MPIPLLVAIGAALISAVGTGGGVAIYKNNKHNKAQDEWQNQKRELQEKIQELQQYIVNKQAKIAELQGKLRLKDEEILSLTKELHAYDQMIDVLEQRQRELESKLQAVIAFITFRYPQFKKDKFQVASDLTSKLEDRTMVQQGIAANQTQYIELEQLVAVEESEVEYYEQEFKEKESALSALSA